jgi:hypothetical protein
MRAVVRNEKKAPKLRKVKIPHFKGHHLRRPRNLLERLEFQRHNHQHLRKRQPPNQKGRRLLVGQRQHLEAGDLVIKAKMETGQGHHQTILSKQPQTPKASL